MTSAFGLVLVWQSSNIMETYRRERGRARPGGSGMGRAFMRLPWLGGRRGGPTLWQPVRPLPFLSTGLTELHVGSGSWSTWPRGRVAAHPPSMGRTFHRRHAVPLHHDPGIGLQPHLGTNPLLIRLFAQHHLDVRIVTVQLAWQKYVPSRPLYSGIESPTDFVATVTSIQALYSRAAGKVIFGGVER